jgi:hypothetical protein
LSISVQVDENKWEFTVIATAAWYNGDVTSQVHTELQDSPSEDIPARGILPHVRGKNIYVDN